jgi:hypothetical protein
LVVSGTFADSEESLKNRSRAVMATSGGVQLSFLDAATLGSIVRMLLREPAFRHTVDWEFVLTSPLIRAQDVADSLRERRRDGVLATAPPTAER